MNVLIINNNWNISDCFHGALEEGEVPETGSLPDREQAPPDVLRIAGKRILLVEDNPINQAMVKEILTGFGVITTLAKNGRDALDVLYRSDFDLVLMDVLAAARVLCGGFRFENLPIVALTAQAMKSDCEKCIQAGMNGYVSKPIDVD